MLEQSGVNAVQSESVNGAANEVKQRIQDWLVEYVSGLMDIPTHKIDKNKDLEAFGLDSSAAVGMTGDLSEWLNSKVDPTVVYDYGTINRISEALSTKKNIIDSVKSKFQIL